MISSFTEAPCECFAAEPSLVSVISGTCPQSVKPVRQDLSMQPSVLQHLPLALKAPKVGKIAVQHTKKKAIRTLNPRKKKNLSPKRLYFKGKDLRRLKFQDAWGVSQRSVQRKDRSKQYSLKQPSMEAAL